jgi:hypothetical protein
MSVSIVKLGRFGLEREEERLLFLLSLVVVVGETTACALGERAAHAWIAAGS